MLLTIQPALTVQTTNLYYSDYSPLTPIQPASASESGPSHARFASDVFNTNQFSSSSSSSRHHYNNYGANSSATTRLSAPVPPQVGYAAYGDYPPASSPGIPPSTSTNHASLTSAAHSLPSRSSLSNFASLGSAGGLGASAPAGLSNSHYDLYSVEHSSPLGTSATQSYLEQTGRNGQDYSTGSSGLHGGLRQDSVYELKNSSFTPLPSVGDILSSSGVGPTRNLRAQRNTGPYSIPSISSRARNAVSPNRYDDAPLPLATVYDADRDNAQQSPRRSARPAPSRKAGSGGGVPLEKNFACKTCGLKFARNHDLTRHHKVHDPIKHYRCKGCDRSFTRRDALKRHNTQKNCGNEEDPQPPAGSGRGRRRNGTISNNVPAIHPDDYVDAPPALTRASLGSVQTGIPVAEAYYGSDAAVGRSNSGYIATGMESIARASKLEQSDRYDLRHSRQHHPRSTHAYAPYGTAAQQS
ncbi:hypothetical protein FRB90_011263 [Tulasnella sp. 427]|nr:hypothetical protein FRB90_011263 [Tulasnella sp. 427]